MSILKQTHFPVNNELRRTYIQTHIITPTTDTCDSEKKHWLTSPNLSALNEWSSWFVEWLVSSLYQPKSREYKFTAPTLSLRSISAALLSIQRSTCHRNFSYKTSSQSVTLQHLHSRYVPLPMTSSTYSSYRRKDSVCHWKKKKMSFIV